MTCEPYLSVITLIAAFMIGSILCWLCLTASVSVAPPRDLTPVHTLDYLRANSPLLLAAVLASASKRFYRDSRYKALWLHATDSLDRIASKDLLHITIMQSEVVLAYSKDPSDPSAWRRVGVAIRMGFQLFFHVNRFAPLPEDRHVARLILVRHPRN